MAKITSIQAQLKNKDRCNVFLDREFAFSAPIDLVLSNNFKVGNEVLESDIKSLVYESDKRKALEKSLAYVSKAIKTKRQVKDYLLRKGYSEEIAYYCIDKLKEYKFIDDAEYVKRYVENNSKTQGKRLYEYKLMMKGVKKEDIEKGVSELQIDGKSNAQYVAEKYLKNKEITKENLAKAYRYLVGKGFSYEEVDFAISKFKEEL